MNCLLHSFAYAAGLDIGDILKILGHNGYALLFPFLTGSQRYRAFTTHEIFEALLTYGYACVDIPKAHWTYRSQMPEGYLLDTKDHVKPYLDKESRYVLYSDTHAIGVKDGFVLDVLGQTKCPEEFDYKGIIVIRKCPVSPISEK